MNFFKKISRSFYSPEFYQQVLKERFLNAIKYFLGLIVLLAIIQTTSVFPPKTLLSLRGETQKVIEKIADIYPPELEIRLTNGQVSTNVNEPYFISLPEVFSESRRSTQNLLVIDTKTPYSSFQFNQYQTLAWLTSDSLFFADTSEGKNEALDLSKTPDLSIDKNQVDALMVKIIPFVKDIVLLVIPLVFLGFYSLYSSRLIYLFFFSIIVFFLLRVFKNPLSYRQCYKLSLYAITPALLIDLFFSLSRRWLNLDGFPYMFTLISLIIVVLNLIPTQSPAVKSEK